MPKINAYHLSLNFIKHNCNHALIKYCRSIDITISCIDYNMKFCSSMFSPQSLYVQIFVTVKKTNSIEILREGSGKHDKLSLKMST